MKRIASRSLKAGGLTGALVISALFFATPAQAGYEFAAPLNFCTNKVDQPGDGSDLRLPIGTVDLEFFGFGLDTAPAVSISAVDGTGVATASIVARHNGVANAQRGCGAIGSITIRITTGPDATTSSFHKRLNIGNAADSRVPLSIRRFPKQDTLAWSSVEGLACLGTRTVQDNNRTMIIQLPPGHRDDHSNCSAAINLAHTTNDDIQVDARTTFKLHFNGLPPGATADNTSLDTTYSASGAVKFALNAATIRALTVPSISNISVAGPNGLTSNTVRLEIRPALGQGIASLAAAPAAIVEGNPTDIRVQLATAATGAGQALDVTANSAACFDLGQFADSPRFADPTIRTVNITAGQIAGTFQFRSRVAATCSALGAGIRHTIKMWVPGTDPVSCPVATCRSVAVNIVARPQ